MNGTDPACNSAEIEAELQRVLASTQFARAYRCIAVLRYLVAQAAGCAHGINEYAIGIAVFGRSASSYNTGDDPIVRVQVGRVRAKLAAYYAAAGCHNPARIVIPVGSYLPRIEACAVQRAVLLPRLAFRPLACLSQDVPAQSFTLGLNEELGYRLHRDFGERLVANPLDGAPGERPARPCDILFEGSVRMDDLLIRTSLRLRDLAHGTLLWSEQLDHVYEASIACQERLADACHAALRLQLGLL
ncbi:MAG TPA: hypothetical protein VFG03_16760 [Telluria sp.]|nr:hypothetical protein [Telluria sp.]